MNFQPAIEALGTARHILLTSHIRPDGDAIGSLVGLQQIIKALNPQAQAHLLLLNKCPDHYQFLLTEEPLVWDQELNEAKVKSGALNDYDLIVVADTSAVRQLPGIGEYLQQRRQPVLVIDHHLSGDKFGSINLVDTSAAAAGELVFQLSQQAQVTLDPTAATALFVAISTDTGWFRFENTHPQSLMIAGQLVGLGAQPDKIYQQLFQNFPPERLRLITMTLETLELHCDGQLAVMHITNEMLKRSGAKRSHIENLVNEPQQIGSVIATMLVVEQDDGSCRVSLRSRERIDVNALANRFNGGGHARASGLTLHEPLPAAREKILAAMKAALR